MWLAGSRAQPQSLWRTGLAAPRHVGSSRTRARTHVPCISRQVLNPCATREAQLSHFGWDLKPGTEGAHPGRKYRGRRALSLATAPGCKRFWHPHFQLETLSICGVECLAGVTSWEGIGLGFRSRQFPSRGYTLNPHPLLLPRFYCQSSGRFLKI